MGRGATSINFPGRRRERELLGVIEDVWRQDATRVGGRRRGNPELHGLARSTGD